MKGLLKKGILIITLVCIKYVGAHAQLSSKYEVGISAGAFIYQGDLARSALGSFKTPGFNLSVFGSKLLNRSFSLRTNLAFGKIKGNDAKYSDPEWRQQRAFNFTSSVFEISELLIWDILGKNNKETNRGLSPYLFGGAGFAFLKIKRNWTNFNSDYFASEPTTLRGLSADTLHSVPRVILAIPLGVGVKYSLTPALSLFTESSFRFTANDYVDGFSQAANPSKKDNYTSYSIGLTYRLGNKNTLDCPVVKQ